MSRTVRQADAERTVNDGNVDFQILSDKSSEDQTTYLIMVPFTVLHPGVFGRSSAGRYTRFGRDLLRTLRSAGVACSAKFWLSTAVEVYIPHDSPEQPPVGFRHGSCGLPASACYAIQVAIMRHDTRTCRFVEYLRGLI